MNITWLGHSCFLIESGGWRVVLDPYYVETYPALHVDADEVLCSHSHRDHAFLEAVTLSGRRCAESPFAVETVSTFHDEKGGALRGENTIHILRAEGLTVVHCGDLGHELSEEQLKKIKGCDALLIPVGGYYTIDALTAKKVADAAAPRILVPIEQFVSTSPSFSTTPPRIGRVSAESVSFAAFPAFWSSAFACSTTACPTRSRSSAQKISSSLPDALARAASCAQSFVYSAVGSERSCCSACRKAASTSACFVSSSCRRAAIRAAP